METRSRVLCAVYGAFLSMRLFAAKGQGPPPQPPTSGPGEADSPSALTRHLIGPVSPTINSVRLWQDGTPNAAFGHLTRITTTATCSTTCP